MGDLMGKKATYLLSAAVVAVAFHGAGEASETTTYSYDALGRLVATNRSGSVNNGVVTSIAYDAAGNRSNYSTSGAPPPPPPPPPPPG